MNSLITIEIEHVTKRFPGVVALGKIKIRQP